MLCEKYKPALIEAAITGTEPAPAVRVHAESCAHCAAELAQQRSLIAAIDGSLHRQMNAPVPNAMLQRFEARLAQQTASASVRSLRLRWLYTGVALATAAAVVFFAMPHLRRPNTNLRTEPESQTAATIKQSPPIVTMVLKPATPQEIERDRKQHARRVARPEPEVLVPPDERIGLEQFIANLNSRADLPAVIVKPLQQQPEQSIAALKTPEIETAALVVQPLQESSTE
ncbi:MAG TPA: hypothetical protein VIH74_02305 [Candidatus Acidoferrum sp.]